ncbi:helix-turn-helix domain-containing protein [Blastococcus sp. CCUG 61487]|uniref:winged helix-turn-helix transcriptional regulator n=1 Tax=Blastococcus sp. CCUG 61487 TaxID=1840703 RepID=UPI0010C0E0F1|nr:helix-turn-helix domain-containing protein [Blastococcus sp. CCUG 61487]TKJ27411.1 HxlR family transcriptional regulator [Blastococcus sp. CCUG 61487]
MTTRLDGLPGRRCSIAGALDVVGDRWALLVVREVSLGAHRFSEILRGTGAPRERLAARLGELVSAGVLERRPYSENPPRSDYHLTKAGRDLLPVLQALMQWGDRHIADQPPVELHHHGHRITASWVCDVCGERVGRGVEHHVPERRVPADG